MLPLKMAKEALRTKNDLKISTLLIKVTNFYLIVIEIKQLKI